jgi:RNA polymerase sigma factor (sigma-70 family)
VVTIEKRDVTRRTPSAACATKSADPAFANHDLVRRCLAGDASAWNDLVHRYERLVYAVPVRLGLGAEDAGDIAQESFAALLRALPAIEDASTLGSWLMTVARRLSWRRLENRSRSEPTAHILTTDRDRSDELVQALWVCEAVDALGEPCASVVRSLFLDPTEPSYSQIASRLGCAIGTVGSLRTRCLARLRLLLEIEASGGHA